MPTEVKLLSRTGSSVTQITTWVQQAIDQLREQWPTAQILSAVPTITSSSAGYVLVVALTIEVTLHPDKMAAFRAFTGQDEPQPGGPAAGGKRPSGADLLR